MQKSRWFKRMTLPICGVQKNVHYSKSRKEKEMAVFETTHPSVIGASVTDRLGRYMTRALSALIAWNDDRATRKALSRLSDRELDDIGLSRSDILAISSRK